jgi:hypothetical protein
MLQRSGRMVAYPDITYQPSSVRMIGHAKCRGQGPGSGQEFRPEFTVSNPSVLFCGYRIELPA